MGRDRVRSREQFGGSRLQFLLCCVVLKWERKLEGGEKEEEGLNRNGRWASARRRQLV